jgi:hypothetical protein
MTPQTERRAGTPANATEVKIIFPVGMLGGGFPPETIQRGLDLGADAIAVDGGTTDSGPYYLGTGTAKTSRAAVERDLRVLVTASQQAGIPLIVTSCGTAGTDSGVDWMADILTDIAKDERLTFRLALIYTEQTPAAIAAAAANGRITPLEPAGPLDPAVARACEHIVGLMGHEPIQQALEAGSQVILAGRATDTASVAALALPRELPPGATWHAAKTVECGALITTKPTSGGVLVEIDTHGFTVQPLDPLAACTPTMVAAHMLYENSDPFLLHEPPGTLDTTQATYKQIDPRTVRVEGSRFITASQHTIKLEGSALVGYETISFAGIRDPHVLARIEEWTTTLLTQLTERVTALLSLEPSQYSVGIRRYGYDAILGPLEPSTQPPREVGVLLKVRADDQDTATAIAKIANPLLLHLPLGDMTHLPSFAFTSSPAELERGPVFEFQLNHVINVSTPNELFRTEIREVTPR